VQEEEREMERESRATYRPGIDGHYSREISGGVTPASSVSREKRGKGGGDDADRWGPPGSEGERGRGIPVRVLSSWAAGWLLKLGRMVSPRALFYFYFLSSFPFLFFLFLS
jgi:hypothetical protein